MENEIYQILKKHKLPLKKREEVLTDLLLLFSVSGSAYLDELLSKFDSMVETANKMFTDEAKKVNEMVIENVKVHVSEIAKKHFR